MSVSQRKLLGGLLGVRTDACCGFPLLLSVAFAGSSVETPTHCPFESGL